MKFQVEVRARCFNLPVVRLRWWITVVVLIFLVPSNEWRELIRLLLR